MVYTHTGRRASMTPEERANVKAHRAIVKAKKKKKEKRQKVRRQTRKFANKAVRYAAKLGEQAGYIDRDMRKSFADAGTKKGKKGIKEKATGEVSKTVGGFLEQKAREIASSNRISYT